MRPIQEVTDHEFVFAHGQKGRLGVLRGELTLVSWGAKGEVHVLLGGEVDHIDRWELLFDQVLPAEHHHLAWLLLTSVRWLLLLLVNYTLVLAAENRGIIVGVR